MQYEEPKLLLILFSDEDVLTASPSDTEEEIDLPKVPL